MLSSEDRPPIRPVYEILTRGSGKAELLRQNIEQDWIRNKISMAGKALREASNSDCSIRGHGVTERVGHAHLKLQEPMFACFLIDIKCFGNQKCSTFADETLH